MKQGRVIQLFAWSRQGTQACALAVFLFLSVSACNMSNTKTDTAAPGAASAVKSSITGTNNIVANGIATSTITITLKDSTGKPISGVYPIFRATGTLNTYGPCTKSNVSGTSTCTLKSTTAETKVLSIISPIGLNGGSVTFNTGVATRLIFSTQPSSTGNTDTALGSQPIVQVADSNGNLIPSATHSITLTAYSDACITPVGGGMSATTNPLSAVAGVATFANVKILKTSVVRIGASAAGLTSVCSDPITISPGAVASIAFTTEPSAAGDTDTVLATQPVIKLYDANSNIVTTNSTASITLAGYSDACVTAVGSSLSATANPKTASSGVATFANLKVLKTSVTYIGASDGSGHSVCSTATVISPGAPYKLAFNTEPSTTGDTDTALAQQPIVRIQDANSNDVGAGTDSITLTGYSDACTTSVASSITATANPKNATAGSDTFANVKVIKTSVTHIGASAAGLVSACSNAMVISPGAPSNTYSTISAFPASVVNDNASLSTITVTIKDANQNVIPSKSVTLVSSRGSTDTIATSPTSTNASGVVTFTVKSSYYGSSALTAAIPADVFTLTQKSFVQFLAAAPQIDYQARLAESGRSVGSNTTTTTWWKDLVLSAATNDGHMYNFANTTASGWGGSGSTRALSAATGPYRLVCDGTDDYINFGATPLQADTSTTVETWIRPASVSTKGSVIVSNGDATGIGMTLRQSTTQAGKLELLLGTKSYSDEVLADVPLSYWRLNERVGTAAVDVMGATNGTYNGGYTVGVSGPMAGDNDAAITFDGITGFVEMGNENLYDFVGIPFSVEGWFKTTDATAVRRQIVSKNDPGGYEWNVELQADHKLYAFFTRSDGTAIYAKVSNVPVNDGVWHHFAAVFNTAPGLEDVTLYVDGADQPTSLWDNRATMDYTDGPGKVIIGARNNIGYEQFFPGSIDEVAIYPIALSLPRVAAHYAASLRTTCQSSTILVNNIWHFVSGEFDSVGPTLNLFVDGVKQCSVTNPAASYANSANPLSLGAAVTGVNVPTAGTYWSGGIADLRGYSSALSVANVWKNFVSTFMRFPFPEVPSVMSGRGNGTFGAATTYATALGAVSIHLADLNNDGILDVVTGNDDSSSLSVLLGVGDGTFAAKTDYAMGARPSIGAVADFNNDGKLDLVGVNYSDNTVSILLGNGDGTFNARTNYATVNSPGSVITGDFNNDGNLDLIVSATNFVSVFLGVGDGTFGARTDYAAGSAGSLVAGDFNGDGNLDFAVARYGATKVAVFIGVGDGTFAAKVDYTSGAEPVTLVTADINRDGILDLIETNGTDNTVSVLLGVGNGTFGAKVDYATAAGPQKVVVSDVNGDGYPDLVVSNYTAGSISVLLGKSDGTFMAKTDTAVAAQLYTLAIGDLNQDGKLDIATAVYRSNTLRIMLGQ